MGCYTAPMFAHPASIITLLTGTMFLAITVFTLLAPLLVDLAREFGTTVPVVGQITAATSIPWALFGPVIGPLSDRYGRRPVLVAGVFALGLTTVAAALAPNLLALIALRLLTGCAGAAVAPTIVASTGDLFHGAARTRAFGWVNAGWALAALVGVPLMAVLAAATHWRIAFVVAGCATMAITLPLSRVPFAPPRGHGTGYLTSYVPLLRRRLTWLTLGTDALERTLYACATTYLPSFLIQRYDLPLGAVALILALIALGALAGNLAGGRMGGLIPPAKLVALCQGGAGVLALLALGVNPPLALVVALLWLFGAANAFSRPTFFTLVTDVGGTARGSMVGILAMANQGGLALGAAAGGLALALAGYPGVGALVGLCGLGAALLALVLNRALCRPPKAGN